MSENALRDRIVDFINSTLAPARRPVTADTPLFEGGLLDSMRVLDLIAFVEGEIGRTIPDSAIRLASFRTAATIATMASSPATGSPSRRDRLWSRTRSRRAGGHVTLDTDIDDAVLAWARELHAAEIVPDRFISCDVLARAGYLASFPGRAVLADAGNAGPDASPRAIPPAACMHCYDILAGRQLAASPVVLTLRNRCARGDDAVDAAQGRLGEFTMREIVILGTDKEVDRTRRALMRRVQEHLTRLNLAATIEVATDPFHTSADRGKQALQRLRALKYELRMPVAGAQIAVASFNDHEDFFGRAFGITLGDGTSAHSGCVAFGLERWDLAVRAQAIPVPEPGVVKIA